MKKPYIKNISITCMILLLCTMLAFVFMDLNIRTENIIMIYLIGVVFIIIETHHLLWAIISSLLSVLLFNYFFTDPYYSLKINDSNYLITIFIFLIVSFITTSLVDKLQQHARISKDNEMQTKALYEITRSYLNMSDATAILNHHIQTLYDVQGIITEIYYKKPGHKELIYYTHPDTKLNQTSDSELAKWCFTQNQECGYHTAFYEHCKWSYHPLRNHHEILGVYTIYHKDDNDDQNIFIHTLLSQMMMALEREKLYEQHQKNKVEIEKEKLRNNLLRTMSHDLRTPLTSIAGSSSLIIENYDTLDDDTILNLIKNVESDAIWLNQLVENLLNMTKIQDGRLLINKQIEVVDDLILEAIHRCDTRKGEHSIEAHLPQNLESIYVDGSLIVQVLINFIDNAIKHTQDTSHIDLYYHNDQNMGVFEVIDNGNGIDPKIEQTLFDSFVTTKNDRSDAKRGVGLGLSICKAIIEAHGGKIYAHQRKDQTGAVFGFQIPKKKEETINDGSKNPSHRG